MENLKTFETFNSFEVKKSKNRNQLIKNDFAKGIDDLVQGDVFFTYHLTDTTEVFVTDTIKDFLDKNDLKLHSLGAIKLDGKLRSHIRFQNINDNTNRNVCYFVGKDNLYHLNSETTKSNLHQFVKDADKDILYRIYYFDLDNDALFVYKK